MLILNTILKEMKDVPVSRLEELYQFVHSLTPATKATRNDAELRKKILSFAGAFSGMSKADFTDFVNKTKKTRATLFDRKIEL